MIKILFSSLSFLATLFTTCLAKLSSVKQASSTKSIITGTNTPLTYKFISRLWIGRGKLLLITEAGALTATLDGIKGQRARLGLRAALAHFHDYSPAEAFLVLCINGLKAPLIPGFSCTATAFGDGTRSNVWWRTAHQFDNTDDASVVVVEIGLDF